MLVNNLFPLIAPVAGSGVLTLTTWVGVFIVLGVCGVLLTVLAIVGLKESLPPEERIASNFKQLLQGIQTLLGDRQFLAYALSQGILIGGLFAYVSGTPFIYQNIYGASPQIFALLFGLNGLSLIIGSQLVGWLNLIFSESHFFVFGLLLSVASSLTALAVILLQGPLLALVLPLFCLVASNGITSTASFSLALESHNHVAGSASALLGLLPFLIGAVTSPLVGIAGEYTALPMGLIILVSSLLALLAYYGLRKS